MAAIFLLAALAFGPQAGSSGTVGAPVYSADSIANSAVGVSGYYAPDTFLSIYGQNLAQVTRAIASSDISAGALPTILPGTGLRVLINSIPAVIWYVSPTLVNVLIPSLLVAGPATLQLEVNGLAGPKIAITLGATAPALFQIDAVTVLGTHLDGSTITAAAPAHSGEIIVLWASGLGPTVPAAISDQLPVTPAVLAAQGDFQIWLNGVAVDPHRILYVGAPQGYAGLFQINLQLPDSVAQNPEIRVGTSVLTSPPQRFLPLQ